MKTKLTAYVAAAAAAFAVALAVPFSGASAQSGRIPPAPQPTPTPQPTPPEPEDGKQAFVADPGADEYRLVFPASYDWIFHAGKFVYKEGEPAGSLTSKFHSFMERLNQAGAQGYRLVSAARGHTPVAIVRLDEVRYEYAWLQTSSGIRIVGPEFGEQYDALAKRGFRLSASLFVNKDCGSPIYEGDIAIPNCDYTDLLLFEKRKGAGAPVRYALAETFLSWGKGVGEKLTDQLSLQRVAGFHPAAVFSKFQILLEHAGDEGAEAADRPDVLVVTSSMLGRHFEKRVREAGRQGYRVALTKNSIAVMTRDKERASPVTYVWLDATKKSFGKELAKLQKKGALYRMIYTDGGGLESKLLFEVGPDAGGVRREYKVLGLEFQHAENAAEKKVSLNLTPSSEENLRLINRLAKEGFVARDLFVSDSRQVNVLLERTL